MASKVWGYARFLSKIQNEENQIEELTPLLESPSDLIIEKKFTNRMSRPEYLKLKELMKEGDTLIIKSLNCLGNYNQIKEEWEELEKRGIKLRILDNPLLDTTQYTADDPQGQFASKIILEVLSFVAGNESNNKRKQAEGIANARANGSLLGRPRTEFPENWAEIHRKWKTRAVTAKQARAESGLTRMTFYNMLKLYEEEVLGIKYSSNDRPKRDPVVKKETDDEGK